jgi:hypothetical protein
MSTLAADPISRARPTTVEAILRETNDGTFEEACEQLIGLYAERDSPVINEIYQGRNTEYDAALAAWKTEEGKVAPRAKSEADDKVDRGGVCCGMSLEWVRLVKNGQEEVFKELIEGNWMHFLYLQQGVEMDRADACAKQKGLMAKARASENFVQDYEQGCDHLARELSWWQKLTLSPKYLRAQAEANQLNGQAEAEGKAAQERMQKVYEDRVYGRRTQEGLPQQRVTCVIDGERLDAVAPRLLDRLAEGALYLMILNGDCGRHALAIGRVQGNLRFMDPNSCDVGFRDPGTMSDYVKDYFTVYLQHPKARKFKEAKCEVYKFL